jgi:hypothetical protein
VVDEVELEDLSSEASAVIVLVHLLGAPSSNPCFAISTSTAARFEVKRRQRSSPSSSDRPWSSTNYSRGRLRQTCVCSAKR